jgi:NAD(P)-dependent dehydrogenase (short-subunit alcohol dehydrogenase family)
MSEQSIDRKVAVITHSSRGIGKVIAYEFAKADYAIVINDIDELELEHSAKDISRVIDDDHNNDGNRVSYILGDTSEEKIAVSLINEAIMKFGRIDVLINNAILVVGKPMKSNEIITYSTAANTYHKEISPYFTLEEYEIVDTSLKAAYLCISEAVKYMLKEEQDRRRRTKESLYSIINISACYESIPKTEANAYKFSNSGVDPYTASRVGVKNLTKTVALQLADKRIRVNAITPGIIDSDIINNKEHKEKEIIPFQRIGQAEEIAKIALFLTSDAASYITGSVIYADGGLSLLHANYFLESEIEQD